MSADNTAVVPPASQPSSQPSSQPLLPPGAVGVIGGGQLGRYFVLAARRLGYDTWVLDPDANGPAMQVATHTLVAAYDDLTALDKLASHCQAVSIEFENVPASSLAYLAHRTVVSPSADHVAMAQDRALEKAAAQRFGLSPVPHARVHDAKDLQAALATLSLPAILKTSRLGYDGKGQIRCQTPDQVREAFAAMGTQPAVLEQQIDLAGELSVVLARGFDGQTAFFPVAQNVHVNGVLHTSSVPQGLGQDVEAEALSQARQLADGLDYHGILAIEFFLDTQGKLWFNEMAPRPHNSGHYTLDACVTSQFEQQLRVACGLPLGSTQLLSPVTMLNLLGDRWAGNQPPWISLFEQSGAKLHLYGKQEARAGRKMGHVNCLADTSDRADETAQVLDLELQAGNAH